MLERSGTSDYLVLGHSSQTFQVVEDTLEKGCLFLENNTLTYGTPYDIIYT